MEQTRPVVRIVVARAVRRGRAVDTIRGLAAAGPRGVELEVVHDAGRCIALRPAGDVDLVVVDHALAVHCERILEALRATTGRRWSSVSREGSDEVALDVFRRGAADCVTLASDADEALPVVALEQIRRCRAARERGAAERRIRDLERYTENIIQNMNSALLVVDMEGRITFCNPPAEQILGEAAEALRGRAVWDWFPDGSGEGMRCRATLAEGVRFKGAESDDHAPDGHRRFRSGSRARPSSTPTGEPRSARSRSSRT